MSYTTETKVSDGAFPRGIGLTHFNTDRIRIAYLKHKNVNPTPDGLVTFNFIFLHGTGMNKGVWKQHIKKLYDRNVDNPHWRVGVVLAIDCHSHGDSARLNKGTFSWGHDWKDGAKDVVEVTKKELDYYGELMPTPYNRNVLVGHSMGGYHAAFAAYLEPVLYDLVISVDPVIYYLEGFNEFFVNKIGKLGRILQDEWNTREEAIKWYKSLFYAVMQDQVLDDFLADELYEENGKTKSRASKNVQLATYLTAPYCVRAGMEALQFIQIPFVHVLGTSATWNPPVAKEFIREESVPANLIEGVDLEGDHLVHGSNVEGMVSTIQKTADKRARFLEEHRAEFPEVKFTDRQQIFDSKWGYMWKADVENSFNYAQPRLARDEKL